MRRGVYAAALIAAAMAGCAPSEPAATPDEDSASVDAGVHRAGQSAAKARGAAQTADEAVREVVEGMRAKRPEAVWEFLPAGYQQDVNELVREFAGRMDAELWNETFATARRATKLLREKKEFILAHPRVAEAERVDAAELEQSWEGLVGLIETLAGSEVSDLENLKQFDGGRFLTHTGGRVMNQIAAVSALTENDEFAVNLDKLGEVEATLVSEADDGQSAVVRLTSPDAGDEPREVEFVLVEGKWIPRDLADEWESTIAGYRTRMLEMTGPESVQQTRDQVLPLLAAVDATISELEKTQTQDEFDAVVQKQILGPLQLLLGKPKNGRRPAQNAEPRVRATPREGAASATVIVRGEIADEAAIERQLREAGAADVTTFSDGDATQFAVTGVGDVAAFAKTLRIGKTAAVDPQRRTITIDVE